MGLKPEEIKAARQKYGLDSKPAGGAPAVKPGVSAHEQRMQRLKALTPSKPTLKPLLPAPKSTVKVKNVGGQELNNIDPYLRAQLEKRGMTDKVRELELGTENASVVRQFLPAVADTVIKSEKAFGETLGGAMATAPQYKFDGTGKSEAISATDRINQSAIDTSESNRALAKLLNDPKTSEEQKARIRQQLGQDVQVETADKLVPAVNKTATQIYGEGLGVALDIASAGQYGVGTKTAQSFKLLPAAEQAANIASKPVAKTAAEAFVQGAKQYGKEGAAMGSGFGASQAMQEDKNAKEILGSTVINGVTGGMLGGIMGGMAERKKFLLPQQAEKMKQKAVEQYKRGLQATKEKYKETTEKIIPDLLDQNVWGTRRSLLKKAEAGISLSEKEYEKLGELVGVTKIDGLLKTIDDEISKNTLTSGRVSFLNEPRVRALKELRADILAVDALDNIQDATASMQKLRELSQSYGKEVYETRKSQKTIMDNKTLSQVKKVDGAIRQLLASDPRNAKYSGINKIYTLNSSLADVLNETAIRKEGRGVVNLIRSLSSGAGIAAGVASGGIPGAVIGGLGLMGLAEMLNSTWWNTWQATRKNALAQKLLQKSAEEASQLLIILGRQGLKAAMDILGEEMPETTNP